MKKKNRRALGAVWILIMLFMPALAAATTYYVDDNGSDGNNGLSAGAPWKTISHAAANISGGTAAAPDILMVAAGTYDVAANGETFPIAFNGNYINLVGNSAPSVIIDTLQPGPSTSTALQVNGKGVNVSGFTFRNADDGIAFTQGGFTVTDTVFTNSVARGITFIRNDTTLSSSVSYGDMSITNTTFQTSSSGIEIRIRQIFDGVTETLTAAFGSLSITGNTFAVAGGGTGILLSDFTISKLLNGSATVGGITVGNNSFVGGDYGIYFSNAGYSEFEDTQLTTGDMIVSNNTFTNQHGVAVYTGFRSVQNVGGNSAVVLGGRTVQDNSITSDPVANPGCQGILGLPDQITGIRDSSTVNISDLVVKKNTLSVDGAALSLQGATILSIGQHYWYDSVTITTGSATISDNVLTSVSDLGILVQYGGYGITVYGRSQVIRGALSVTNNTVQSDGPTCMIMDNSPGTGMFEDSSLLIKDINIKNNSFTSKNDNALYISRSGMANGLQDNSSVTTRSLNVSNNTLISPASGINLMYSSSGVNLQDKASYAGGAVIIDNNIIQPGTIAGMGSGIFFMINSMGSGNQGPTSSTVGDIDITNNRVSGVIGVAIQFQISSIGSSITGTGRVAVGDVDISDNTMDTANYGLYMVAAGLYAESGAAVTVGKLNINSNSMTNISGIGVYSIYQAQNDDPDTATLGIGTIHIDDNSISGTAAGSNGIYLAVDMSTPGITFGAPYLSTNSVSGFQNGINLIDDVKDAEIECNTLSNNTMAGLLFSSNETITVVNNSIVDNGMGLQITGTATVTAEKNWWGDAAGPGACTSCNKINAGGGTVDYDPWLATQNSMQCSRLSWPMFMPAIIGNHR